MPRIEAAERIPECVVIDQPGHQCLSLIASLAYLRDLRYTQLKRHSHCCTCLIRRSALAGRSSEPPVNGSGEFQQFLRDERINSRCRTQPPANRGGFYSKDRFDVDVEAATVTCPAGVSVLIRSNRDNSGVAFFGAACETCVQRSRCTAAKAGRTVRVSRHETVLADARGRSQNPAWKRDYQATRPKVERRLAHLKRRWHGGRRARVRGRPKVDADFNLLAAAHNIARLAALGLHHKPTHWALA